MLKQQIELLLACFKRLCKSRNCCHHANMWFQPYINPWTLKLKANGQAQGFLLAIIGLNMNIIFCFCFKNSNWTPKRLNQNLIFFLLKLFGKIWFEVKMGILIFIVTCMWRGELKGWNEWRPTIDTPVSWNVLTTSISQVENLKLFPSFTNKYKILTRKKQNEKNMKWRKRKRYKVWLRV